MRAAKIHFEGGDHLVFWCPGCKDRHAARIDGEGVPRPAWRWNGDDVAPTLTGSVLNDGCEVVVEEGRLHYHQGCAHPWRGLSVQMAEVDAEGYASEEQEP